MDRAAQSQAVVRAAFIAAECLEKRLLLSAVGKHALDLVGNSPAIFVENRGQWVDQSVRYALQTSRANVLMTDHGPIFQVFQAGKTGIGRQFFALFDQANVVQPQGLDRSGANFNFYLGDPARWRTGVRGYRKILYDELYDGIDLYTWGRRNSLKYEFHVAPQADWRQIQISYSGIEGLSIDSKGRLHVSTQFGELIDDAPVVWQVVDGKRVRIKASFKLIDNDTYTFQLSGSYDPARQLVIDPDLEWSAFLGGSGDDRAQAVALDPNGNIYVAGVTASANFPSANGFDTTLGSTTDAFITKIDVNGNLLWSSYLGGSSADSASGIAVDASAAAYITGSTSSTNFPTSGGFDLGLGGATDAFVAKVTSTGTLSWSSYLGGSSNDSASAIAVDSVGNVYVTGSTSSSDFPLSDAYDSTLSGTSDGFVTRISTTPDIVWSTYLGGNLTDSCAGIAVRASHLRVIGSTTSTSGLATAGAYDESYNTDCDAFVGALNTSGQVQWITYLGGDNADNGAAVDVDSSGNTTAAGDTNSTDFPTLNAYDNSLAASSTDAFVTRFDVNGQPAFSTYLGGTGNDAAYALVMSGGDTFVVGSTASTDFPISDAFDSTYNLNTDAFVASFNNTGQLDWSSYLGGGSSDTALGVDIDSIGNVVVVGHTSSNDFPAFDSFDTTYAAGTDAFVAHIDTSTTGLEPAQPTNLTAVAVSMSRIDLRWTDNSDNELGFEIYRRLGSGGDYSLIGTVGVNITRYSDEGLQPDTQYVYRVRAFNVVGQSPYSNPAKATTRTANLLAPSDLTATAYSSKRIDLSWKDNSNNESAFEIWRQQTSVGIWELIDTVGRNVTIYRDQTGLSPDTEYAYQVRAINAYRNSDYAGPVTATTKPADYLVPPSGLGVAKVSDSSNRLRWQDNSDNETGFSIERAEIGGSYAQIATTTANEASYTDVTVVPGTVYLYRVRAFNATSFSDYSNVATSDLARALAAPTRFEAQAYSPSRITLTWKDNAIIETAYVIERRIGSSDDWAVVKQVNADTTRYTDKNLLPNTVYSYRIRATDGTNFSNYSRTVSERTLPTFVSFPRTPSAVKAKALSTSSIRLSWRDNAANNTSYSIERAASSDGPFVTIDTVGGDATSYTDTGLSAGTTYYYRVRARIGSVRGEPSSIVSATTLAAPTVSIFASDPVGSESGDPLKFVIRRRGASNDQSLTVYYVLSGTARPGRDYQDLTGKATILAGRSSVSVVVKPLDDHSVEDDETVTLRLVGRSTYRISPGTFSATGQIQDNDPGVAAVGSPRTGNSAREELLRRLFPEDGLPD